MRKFEGKKSLFCSFFFLSKKLCQRKFLVLFSESQCLLKIFRQMLCIIWQFLKYGVRPPDTRTKWPKNAQKQLRGCRATSRKVKSFRYILVYQIVRTLFLFSFKDQQNQSNYKRVSPPKK